MNDDKPTRREEAISYHSMVEALSRTESERLAVQYADDKERRRIAGNEFMSVAATKAERREMRASDIQRANNLRRK